MSQDYWPSLSSHQTEWYAVVSLGMCWSCDATRMQYIHCHWLKQKNKKNLNHTYYQCYHHHHHHNWQWWTQALWKSTSWKFRKLSSRFPSPVYVLLCFLPSVAFCSGWNHLYLFPSNSHLTWKTSRANAQTIHNRHTYRTSSQSSPLHNQPSLTFELLHTTEWLHKF